MAANPTYFPSFQGFQAYAEKNDRLKIPKGERLVIANISFITRVVLHGKKMPSSKNHWARYILDSLVAPLSKRCVFASQDKDPQYSFEIGENLEVTPNRTFSLRFRRSDLDVHLPTLIDMMIASDIFHLKMGRAQKLSIHGLPKEFCNLQEGGSLDSQMDRLVGTYEPPGFDMEAGHDTVWFGEGRFYGGSEEPILTLSDSEEGLELVLTQTRQFRTLEAFVRYFSLVQKVTVAAAEPLRIFGEEVLQLWEKNKDIRGKCNWVNVFNEMVCPLGRTVKMSHPNCVGEPRARQVARTQGAIRVVSEQVYLAIVGRPQEDFSLELETGDLGVDLEHLGKRMVEYGYTEFTLAPGQSLYIAAEFEEVMSCRSPTEVKQAFKRFISGKSPRGFQWDIDSPGSLDLSSEVYRRRLHLRFRSDKPSRMFLRRGIDYQLIDFVVQTSDPSVREAFESLDLGVMRFVLFKILSYSFFEKINPFKRKLIPQLLQEKTKKQVGGKTKGLAESLGKKEDQLKKLEEILQGSLENYSELDLPDLPEELRAFIKGVREAVSEEFQGGEALSVIFRQVHRDMFGVS